MLKLAYCGDDCNYCPRYLATQSGDEERLKEVAEMWWTVGWRNTIEPPEKLQCNGRASPEICELGVRECAMAKGPDSCGKCTEYPCDKYMIIFDVNKKRAIICKEKFSKENYELFMRAFFTKKERLDKINAGFKANLWSILFRISPLPLSPFSVIIIKTALKGAN